MPTFDFTVKIEADTKEESREVILAMIDIMKTVRSETSTREFIEFATKLHEKPSLVKKAKFFM